MPSMVFAAALFLLGAAAVVLIAYELQRTRRRVSELESWNEENHAPAYG